MTSKDKIRNLLKDGLKQIDFSEYPFGKVRDILEELGYTLGDPPEGNSPDQVTDGINGWELDYCAYIYKDKQYAGYILSGSFGYGTCNLKNYDISD